jgi:hypothetical protein
MIGHPEAQRRFLWIELLVGAAILGVLASIGVVIYRRHIRHARTTEALLNIGKIYQGAVAYWEADHGNLDRQFPASQATTPALGSCCAQPGDRCDPGLSVYAWKSPMWTALGFSIDQPFYYSYRFDSDGVNAKANFSAWAFGDLDCDGVFSTFMRSVRVNDPVTHCVGGLFTKDEDE